MNILILLLSLLISSRSFADGIFPESRPGGVYGPKNHLPLNLPDAAFGTNPKRIALYDDVGTWDDGREHIKLFFKEHGYTYTTIHSETILRGELNIENFDLLYMPGGESWKYLEKLGDPGAQVIRGFVKDGGGYVGICAGAFYATSMREGGYHTGSYGIGLLDGTAYDGTALKKAPFLEGMMDFDFFIKGLLPRYRIVLFGGPSFLYSEQEAQKKQIEVLSRFQQINEPAMIRFRYGQGRVFLTGPHLEIEENLVDWGEKYQDPESDWPILQHATDWLLESR